jgi:pimeloyl-ACP methyl ester carboxylesterase
MNEDDLTLQLKQARISATKMRIGIVNYNCYETEDTKVCEGNTQEKLFVHCSHGFGASGLSWVYFMENVNASRKGDVQIIAHDTFGFGFTDRELSDEIANDLGHVTLEANGQASVLILSRFILSRSGGEGSNAVFVGHSMGSISAICSAVNWIETGKSCSAVLLIAPAIQAGESNAEVSTINMFFRELGAPLAAIFSMILGLTSLSFRRETVKILLLVAVNIPFFWYLGLRYAFSGPPLSASVAYYQAPMKRENWRELLVDFIEGNVWERRSISNESMHEKIQKLITKKVPIIIIHAYSDNFVPYKNSEKLVTQFGAENINLESVDYGGHMPHETNPSLLCDTLQKYNILT